MSNCKIYFTSLLVSSLPSFYIMCARYFFFPLILSLNVMACKYNQCDIVITAIRQKLFFAVFWKKFLIINETEWEMKTKRGFCIYLSVSAYKQPVCFWIGIVIIFLCGGMLLFNGKYQKIEFGGQRCERLGLVGA